MVKIPDWDCKRKLSPQKLPLFQPKPGGWSVNRIPAGRLTKLWVPECPSLPLRSWRTAGTEASVSSGAEG